jgi:hypothetical protein
MKKTAALDRGDYGEIYRHAFGKSASREACQQGWERWQAIWRSGVDTLIVHPTGTTAITRDDDRFIVARNGPLRFIARTSREHFPTLPGAWVQAAEHLPSMNITRSFAREFVNNSLVDGYGAHPTFGPLMAAAVAWLFTNSEVGKLALASGYRLIGYDISFIPGPPGKARMFNFRALMHWDADVEAALNVASALPLPPWQSPPH